MIFEIERIIRDLRTFLNLNPRRAGPIAAADIETLTLDRRIALALPEAVRRVETAAPWQSLISDSPSFADPDPLFSGDDGETMILLPPDFMRLVELRLERWGRAVHDPADPDSGLVRLARSPGGSVVANGDSPIAFAGYGPGGKILILPGAGDDGPVSMALYRREPRLGDDGTIEIAAPLYDTVVEQLAKNLTT
ncbi:MAG: hypothetical protein NC336_06560 [Clostridium sp.]|nr:hypothetical protein [Clostridium sp.]